MSAQSAFATRPVVNDPYLPPTQHYELDPDGQPTGVLKPGRRESVQAVAVPAARRRRPRQAELGLFGGETALHPNRLVNEIRGRVDAWRALRHRSPGGDWGVTPETKRLLQHWEDPDRPRRLFFCQREAVETLIWLTEVAPKAFRKDIEAANAEANPGLHRLACKMATGAGKTTVMAMIVAWHTVNRARRPGSRSFSDAFLVVAPGITIRDRLRVLEPTHPANLYAALNLVPADLRDALGKARVVITNYHAFMPRDREQVSKLNRRILGGREGEKSFLESDGDVVRRVAKDLMRGGPIVVLNDEAHHCYRHKVGATVEVGLTAEDKEEAKRNEDAARVWIGGIEAFERTLGVRALYDLSATPFFLRGSGYPEGSLFHWVVSDFGLLDAIESGIVKVPRLPVLDDAVQGELPKFRDLYRHAVLANPNALPRKGRGKQAAAAMDPQKLPYLFTAAAEALYRHYEGVFQAWAATPELRSPPVFIVVCNNTSTSKLVADWIGGYEATDETGATRVVPGHLPLFSNVDRDGRWLTGRRTLLIDSEELDSGGALSPEFLEAARPEIEAFKKDLKAGRDPRDPDRLSDADILREVMNTIGRPGRLGAGIRCVVSVSMLTEGWDANTVTHILGLRAFGTQLLCEQVVGRGLRRVTYEVDPATGLLPVEYAEVLGIPFSFAQQGTDPVPKPPPRLTRVHALVDREAARLIRFPRVEGYRALFPRRPLRAAFTDDSRMVLTPDDVPVETLVEPLIGERLTLDLRDCADSLRLKSVVFDVAGFLLREKFRDAEGALEVWRYPELVRIVGRWFDECLDCRDGTMPQFLKWRSLAVKATDRIYRSLVASQAQAGPEALLPIVSAYNPEGSTRHVDFNTAKESLLATRRSHVNYVVCDGDWEAHVAERLEGMDEVVAYVKNHNVGFEAPYEVAGETHLYRPDFIARIDDGGPEPLNLVVEVKGRRDERDAAKAETMRGVWVPAVNAARRFGRWGFVELKGDVHDTPARIREAVRRPLAAAAE